MAEPAFYRCRKCSHTWSRMQFKMRRNPPAECPSCGAGEDEQGLDEVRERQYVSQVYEPFVSTLLGAPAATAAPVRTTQMLDPHTGAEYSVMTDKPYPQPGEKLDGFQRTVLDAVGKLLPVREELYEVSDSLTAQVRAAEDLLRELQLGVPIHTQLSGAVPTNLAYRKVAGRTKRKEWRLVIEEQGVAECVALVDANQKTKAEALLALPDLLRDGVVQMEEMILQRRKVIADTTTILKAIREHGAAQEVSRDRE